MKTPVSVTKAWKVNTGHSALARPDYAGIRNDPEWDECPGDLLFHTKAAAIEATEAWLRICAERDPISVTYRPPWGPRFCDFKWEEKHGKADWEWRVHRLTITRTDEGVEVEATFDYRILVTKNVPTTAVIDGKEERVGWHSCKMPHGDWEPFVNPDYPKHADPDGRMQRSWTIEPRRVELKWGDEA